MKDSLTALWLSTIPGVQNRHIQRKLKCQGSEKWRKLKLISPAICSFLSSLFFQPVVQSKKLHKLWVKQMAQVFCLLVCHEGWWNLNQICLGWCPVWVLRCAAVTLKPFSLLVPSWGIFSLSSYMFLLIFLEYLEYLSPLRLIKMGQIQKVLLKTWYKFTFKYVCKYRHECLSARLFGVVLFYCGFFLLLWVSQLKILSGRMRFPSISQSEHVLLFHS